MAAQQPVAARGPLHGPPLDRNVSLARPLNGPPQIMRPITSEDYNLGEVSANLEGRLPAFNEAASGPLPSKTGCAAVRSDAGALLGGLVGEIFLNAVYIQHLWVDEAHRRPGTARPCSERLKMRPVPSPATWRI